MFCPVDIGSFGATLCRTRPQQKGAAIVAEQKHGG